MTNQKDYKQIVIFLAKFVGIYLIGNILYGLFIEYYYPGPDPITLWTSRNVAFILKLLQEPIFLFTETASPYVSFLRGSASVIRVFEGCNGINVAIVYIAFLFAFKGSLKQTLVFLLLGLLVIYVSNLVRVSLLYGVAIRFPSTLYFFHKYLFTGILYLVVFILWYLWIRQIKSREQRTTAA
jgi:exosortase family protein XrtF